MEFFLIAKRTFIPLTILSVLIISNSMLLAQDIPSAPNHMDKKDRRQGDWVILYDSNWEITQSPNEVEFYRIIKYKNNRPVGIVKDYFRSGQVQMEASLIKDRPEAIFDGSVTWYSEDGIVTQKANFDNGKLIDFYNLDDEGRDITPIDDLISYAEASRSRSDYIATIHWYGRALSRLKDESKSDYTSYTNILRDLSRFYIQYEEYDNAISLLNNYWFNAFPDSMRMEHSSDLFLLSELKYASLMSNNETAIRNWYNIVQLRFNSGLDPEGGVYTKSTKDLVQHYLNEEKSSEVVDLCNHWFAKNKDHPNINDSEEDEFLSYLGRVYKEQKEYDLAEDYYLKAYNLSLINAREDDYAYFSRAYDLCVLYDSKGETQKLDSIARLTTNTIGELYQWKNVAHYDFVTEVSGLYQKNSMYKKLGDLYAIILDNNKSDLSGFSELRHGIIMLAEYYVRQNKYEAAERFYLEAIEIGAEHDDEIDDLQLLKEINKFYLSFGKYSKAETLYLDPLNKLTEAGDIEYIDNFEDIFGLLINFYLNQNQKELAELVQEEVDVRKALYDEKSKLTRNLLRIAHQYETQGRQGRANSIFIEVESQLDPRHGEYLDVVNLLIDDYTLSGKYEKVEKLYFDAITYKKEDVGVQNMEYAMAILSLAKFYEQLGLYVKAEPLLDESYSIILTQYGAKKDEYEGVIYVKDKTTGKLTPYRKQVSKRTPPRPEYYDFLSEIVKIYDRQGYFLKANSMYQELLHALNEGSEDYVQVYVDYIGLLLNNGLYVQSLEEGAKLLRVTEQVYDHEDINYNAACAFMANVYEQFGYTEKSKILRSSFKNGIDSLLRISNKAEFENIEVAINLAELYERAGFFKEAESFLKVAINAALEEERYNPRRHVKTIVALAKYYQSNLQYSKANDLFEEANEIVVKNYGKEHLMYMDILKDIADNYVFQELLYLAEPIYEEILTLTREHFSMNYSMYNWAITNLIFIYEQQGLYEKTESLYLDLYNSSAINYGVTNPNYYLSMLDLIVYYLDNEMLDKAEPLLEKSLLLSKEIYGKGSLAYYAALQNQAGYDLKKGMFKEAEIVYKEDLQNMKVTLGTNSSEYQVAANNLAYLYKEMNLDKKADSLYLDLLNEYLPVEYEELHQLDEMYNKMELFVHLQRYDEAEKFQMTILELIKKQLGKTSDYYDALADYADLLLINEKYAKAEQYFLEVNNEFLSRIYTNFSNLTEKEKGTYYSLYSDSFEKFHSLLMKRITSKSSIIGNNYNYVLATKGMLFRSQAKIKNYILQSNDQELMSLYKQWLTQKAALSKLYEMTPERRAEIGVDIQIEEGLADSLEKKLASRSSLFAIENDETKYTWKDVRNSLAPDEAAIEIVRFRYFEREFTDSVMYLAMIVTDKTKGHPDLVVLDNGNELEGKAYKAYRNAISYKLKDKHSYGYYWSKIAPYVEGKKRVYLSADGIYHSVSLNGILNPKTEKYILDEIDIHKVTSTVELVAKKRHRNSINEAKLLGFPAYEKNDSTQNENGGYRSLARAIATDSTNRFFNGAAIPQLPGTRKEIDNMQETLDEAGIPVSKYMLDNATESEVKQWENPKIAHFATHGYFLKDLDEDTNFQRVGGISRDVVFDNPLLRSGLLMANASDAIIYGGDGILTAYEAKDLNLFETELVVLSACETGLGEVKNGEGVYGLQRAFQSAGAESVIMTLWTVNDQATQEFMTMFYKFWLLNRESKRDAFKHAQSNLRIKYPQPYYWAAFIIIGG